MKMMRVSPIGNPPGIVRPASALLALLILSQINCASERPVVKPETPKEPVAEEAGEANVDLSGYIRDDFTIPPTTWEAEHVTLDTSLPFEVMRSEPDSSIPAEDQTAMGWRVQIFTSDRFDSASAMLEQARLEFPETGVYLAYEAPYYRIQLGDAQNIVDAEILLRRIQQMGYSGAFRVPTGVYLYPELRFESAVGADSLVVPADSTDFEAMPDEAPTSP